MTGYLIAEEGPLAGLTVPLENGTEWVLGRDPDEATILLEDPRVSRKHVICRLTPEGFLLENLSSVNPSTQNGKVITEPVLLKEGDILQIGTTYFRFTEQSPSLDENTPITPPAIPLEIDPEEDLDTISFDLPASSRWLLKVISGPNAGAEFSIFPNQSYILGRDPNTSDVVFHDLSVSREHAKLQVSGEEQVILEDLNTRNGVIVNGMRITSPIELSAQDLIALGSTSFLLIDRNQIHETILSAPLITSQELDRSLDATTTSEPQVATPPVESTPQKHWKELMIPTKYLVSAGVFCVLLLVMVTSTFSLFRSEQIVLPIKNEEDTLKEYLKPFTSVQFSYNNSSGKLFLIGHVLTVVDKQELTYTLSTFPFIHSIEDTVVIDELVWQNMNALLSSYPEWQAVTVHAPTPGKFLLKGYVQTLEQAEQLNDYINSNFPYPNLLENQIIIGNNLLLRIQGLLIEENMKNIAFNLAGGELVLSGKLDENRSSDLSHLLKQFELLPGIRSVQNFVISTSADTSLVDLSSQYTVTGFSSGANKEQFVVINQKIFAVGDYLNGMRITQIQPNTILLEKDGIKFRINYNLQ